MDHFPNRTIAIAILAITPGCANLDYVLTNYGSLEPVVHKNRYDAFQIFDKPGEGRLLISSSPEAATASAFVRGWTFGASGPTASKPIYQQAVEEYFLKSGRQCRITDASFIIEPQWEFRYDCASALARPAPAITGAVRR